MSGIAPIKVLLMLNYGSVEFLWHLPLQRVTPATATDDAALDQTCCHADSTHVVIVHVTDKRLS